MTDDKFKMRPIWVSWEEHDNHKGIEHHVKSLIRENGVWTSGNLWDLNENGDMHNGLMITVCERNVPGEYVFHQQVMSEQECAHRCSGEMFGRCENFCGKGGYCFSNRLRNGGFWNKSEFESMMLGDQLNYTAKIEIEKSYQCRNGHQIIFI